MDLSDAVKELMKRRQKLVIDLTLLLQRFETETGVAVSDITPHHAQVNDKMVVYSVEIAIQFPTDLVRDA